MYTDTNPKSRAHDLYTTASASHVVHLCSAYLCACVCAHIAHARTYVSLCMYVCTCACKVRVRAMTCKLPCIPMRNTMQSRFRQSNNFPTLVPHLHACVRVTHHIQHTHTHTPFNVHVPDCHSPQAASVPAYNNPVRPQTPRLHAAHCPPLSIPPPLRSEPVLAHSTVVPLR